LLQQAIPAKIAGVKRIVMVSPAGEDLRIHPAILVAAQSVGISEIYRVGGPQAIAALAYGTKTIAPVEMIVGTGDFYTNLAKKLVSDYVKVDSLSLASDLVIIADNRANPQQLALDLLAQAEQYSLAAGILLTTDKALALIVQEEVQKQLQVHPQRLLTEKAIAHYGVIVVVESLEKAIELSNLFAPTHLSLMIDEPWDIISSLRQSGTILLGTTTPKAVADYLGGPVAVETFLQSSTLIEYPADSFEKIAHNLQILAQAEGFTATDAGIESRSHDDI
jgi:histidinol dehydrogenase